MRTRSLKLISFSILLGLVAIAISCKSSKTAASPKTDSDNALLWKIEGKKLKSPSYLYGTIHIIGSDDYFLPNGLNEAFEATEQLALELDMDDPRMAMALLTGGIMKNDTVLADLLDEKTYAQVNAYFTDSLGMPGAAMATMEKMQPFLLASMMYPKMLDSEMKSYEMEFVKMAKNANKEVFGLETVEDQLSTISKIPYTSQANMLAEMVTEFGEQKARTQQMIDLYVNQDITGLHKYVTESEDMEGYEEFMLDTRNQNWIPVIGEMASEKPTLFAVGAGHLYGEQGVIKLLQNAGYTLTPVK